MVDERVSEWDGAAAAAAAAIAARLCKLPKMLLHQRGDSAAAAASLLIIVNRLAISCCCFCAFCRFYFCFFFFAYLCYSILRWWRRWRWWHLRMSAFIFLLLFTFFTFLPASPPIYRVHFRALARAMQCAMMLRWYAKDLAVADLFVRLIFFIWIAHNATYSRREKKSPSISHLHSLAISLPPFIVPSMTSAVFASPSKYTTTHWSLSFFALLLIHDTYKLAASSKGEIVETDDDDDVQ